MNTNEIQDAIIEDFSMLPDWEAKYEYLMDMESSLTPLDEKYKTDEYLVHGCNSKAWVVAELQDNKVQYTAGGETAIARGILAIMITIFGNRTPEEIRDTELYFIDKIGLKENLSMTRAQGLEQLIGKIYILASDIHDKQAL